MSGGEWPAVVVRWGTFVTLLIIIGAVVFRVAVLGRLGRRSEEGGADALPGLEARTALWGALAALALVPLAIGRLAVQVAELRDPSEPWSTPASLMLEETVWGTGWWLQVAGAFLCLVGCLVVRAATGEAGQGRRRAGWASATVGALVIAVTPALSGHAVGSQRLTAAAVIADALHVLGAGAWIGSLAVMVTMLGRRRGLTPAFVASMVRAFSPVALGSTAMIVASGVFASWLHVDALASLWTTPYGRVLLLKVGLFVVVAAIGGFNWQRLTPRLGTEAGVDTLRTSGRTEVVVAALVLLATAVLVATALPGEG